MSKNVICPFCHRRIWACICVRDFDNDDDTPVTNDEYDNKIRKTETIDPDTLESPYLNPEELAIFHEPLNKAEERFCDALRKDLENLGPKEKRVFELRFRKDKQEE